MNNYTSLAFSIRKQSGNTFVFPDLIYIDTNSILDVVLNRTYGSLVEQYWRELVRNDGMIIWSRHTVEEVINTVHINEYIVYAEQQGINDILYPDGKIKKFAWKVAEDKVSNQESSLIASTVMTKVNSVFATLEQYGLESDNINDKELNQLANALYRNYGGSLKDAKHVASANLSETNYILSQDSGILRYPAQNVLGASKKLLCYTNSNQTPVDFIDLSLIANADENDEQET